ncbi:MAG: twitching motility protein PilT [Flavobacteriaceae bacterium CG_4_8_14_3_um_filter_34_10]|nr:PIN domain-containing protein [Flavobacteriia bacterium]OIP49211.1 MAG: twitching motility protein PilT [Flavobacteriaceae bacterium CG2_30_34_30]PIQ19082.1 MAG: twitching motility protein PilT [Flavobacteriaceae bacterium CG18_big_fil_WC_8_21_14_2_50_34_36]PIV48787.1 MAG: twitching motility protein PilT [Flavobacteriaceae bacterium CG02_land_8_20_14_3_00_34_13]PIX09225.1 MAG: twitching motility protein PilT [Flavobacteriaceae bacterium CG_4_8_14_3_um_filter_34_10]PIZ08098.1 MAG: twitching 
MVFKLFIDSDVVIDFFTDRAPHANSASELFELNEKGRVILYLSAVSINNIYYIVRRFLGHKKTLEVVETLTEMTEIIGTTRKEILQALRNDFSDYEDSIQYSSALTVGGLDAIITRNTKDYKNSNIAVMTPLNFLKMKERNED